MRQEPPFFCKADAAARREGPLCSFRCAMGRHLWWYFAGCEQALTHDNGSAGLYWDPPTCLCLPPSPLSRKGQRRRLWDGFGRCGNEHFDRAPSTPPHHVLFSLSLLFSLYPIPSSTQHSQKPPSKYSPSLPLTKYLLFHHGSRTARHSCSI